MHFLFHDAISILILCFSQLNQLEFFSSTEITTIRNQAKLIMCPTAPRVTLMGQWRALEMETA